jgi:hypothetical protein
MISLTCVSSTGYKTHFVSEQNIARITEAGPNSAGIRCYVVLFNGVTLECYETAASINDALLKE